MHEFESVLEASIRHVFNSPIPEAKLINHHSMLPDLSLEVLPTQSQLAYSSLGTVDSALLSSSFRLSFLL